MRGQEGPGAQAPLRCRTGRWRPRLAGDPGWAAPLQRQGERGAGGDRGGSGHTGTLGLQQQALGLEAHTGLFLDSSWLCFLLDS